MRRLHPLWRAHSSFHRSQKQQRHSCQTQRHNEPKVPNIPDYLHSLQDVCRSPQRPPRNGVPLRRQKRSPDICHLPRRLAHLFVPTHLFQCQTNAPKTAATSATRTPSHASKPPSTAASTSSTQPKATPAVNPSASWAVQLSILAGTETTSSCPQK
jgi:hypothetical protein